MEYSVFSNLFHDLCILIIHLHPNSHITSYFKRLKVNAEQMILNKLSDL